MRNPPKQHWYHRYFDPLYEGLRGLGSVLMDEDWSGMVAAAAMLMIRLKHGEVLLWLVSASLMMMPAEKRCHRLRHSAVVLVVFVIPNQTIENGGEVALRNQRCISFSSFSGTGVTKDRVTLISGVCVICRKWRLHRTSHGKLP